MYNGGKRICSMQGKDAEMLDHDGNITRYPPLSSFHVGTSFRINLELCKEKDVSYCHILVSFTVVYYSDNEKERGDSQSLYINS